MENKLRIEQYKESLKMPYDCIHLNSGDKYIGTIFGKIDRPTDKFEIAHNILHVRDNGHIVATIWDCEVESITEVKS